MLRLEHVCVRWSLSVCVVCVCLCVCERERRERWSLSLCVWERERWSLSVWGGVRACVFVCVCERERDGVLVCVGGCVHACVCVCVCRGVLCGGCNLSVHGFIIERWCVWKRPPTMGCERENARREGIEGACAWEESTSRERVCSRDIKEDYYISMVHVGGN